MRCCCSACLDLRTGDYRGAGADTTAFPAESVTKVLIAAQLLAAGQMDASTTATALRMITTSDDAAADALYWKAGGDRVVDLVAARYGIADLGAPPPVPGRWGLTRVTARGLVHLYAALSRDPAVWPWLGNAMGHTAAVAADGTDQRFGLLAAAPAAAVKQDWGHDGVAADGSATGNAVVLSTGFADGGQAAMAVLTSGPAGTYLTPLTATVTAQARWLLWSPPAVEHTPTAAATARVPPQPPVVPVAAALLVIPITAAAAIGMTRHGRAALRARADRRELERRARRRRRALARWSAGNPVMVRLPSGQQVTVRRTPPTTATPSRPATALTV